MAFVNVGLINTLLRVGGLLGCEDDDLCGCSASSLKRRDLFSLCFLQVRGRIQKILCFVPRLFVETFKTVLSFYFKKV